MEPEVGDLLDERARRPPPRRRARPRAPPPPPCARRLRDRRGARRRTSPRAASLALLDPAPEPRREARLGAGVTARGPAGRTRRRIASPSQSSRSSSTASVFAGRLALAPELLPRAAPEPRLAGLARAAQRLLVHPGEHQHAAARRVLDDRGRQIRTFHPASFELALELADALRPLVHDRGDERRLGAGGERVREVRCLAGAAGGDHRRLDGVGDRAPSAPGRSRPACRRRRSRSAGARLRRARPPHAPTRRRRARAACGRRA